eukprot:PhF_6_TR7831/c0_g1_i2/m.11338
MVWVQRAEYDCGLPCQYEARCIEQVRCCRHLRRTDVPFHWDMDREGHPKQRRHIDRDRDRVQRNRRVDITDSDNQDRHVATDIRYAHGWDSCRSDGSAQLHNHASSRLWS